MATRKRKKSTSKAGNVTLDFGHKDAKSSGGGGNPRLPEGDYPVKAIKVERAQSKESENTYLKWTLKITDGKYKGKTIIARTMLTPKSLWVLGNLLEAAGKNIPNKTISIDPKKFEGLEFGVTLTDDEYNGRIKSEVTDYISLDLIGQDDEDEEEEEYDDEDEDDEDDDEDEEDDEEEEEEDEDDDDLEAVDLDDL